MRVDHDSSPVTIDKLLKEVTRNGWDIETYSNGEHGCVVINAGKDEKWIEIGHGRWRIGNDSTL